jgi:hypothetical protein
MPAVRLPGPAEYIGRRNLLMLLNGPESLTAGIADALDWARR